MSCATWDLSCKTWFINCNMISITILTDAVLSSLSWRSTSHFILFRTWATLHQYYEPATLNRLSVSSDHGIHKIDIRRCSSFLTFYMRRLCLRDTPHSHRKYLPSYSSCQIQIDRHHAFLTIRGWNSSWVSARRLEGTHSLIFTANAAAQVDIVLLAYAIYVE